MKKGICCVIGAGECDKIDYIPDNGDLVIAADGGFITAKNNGLSPHITVGDFDSLGYTPDNINTVKLPVQKDITDTYAAIEEGIKRGYKNFILYGGTGGRTDHTIANIQCAAALSQNGLRLLICDGERIICAITNSRIEFGENLHGFVSVFAHSETCTGVTINGLKYPLTEHTLTNTFPLGVSNELTGAAASIEVKNGTLIIVYPRYDGWNRL